MVTRFEKKVLNRVRIEELPYDKRSDDEIYFGRQDSGKRTDYGINIHAVEGIMSGHYKRDKLNGEGVHIHVDYTYQGEYSKGKRHGFGKLKKEGYAYIGNWTNGLRDGKGMEKTEVD